MAFLLENAFNGSALVADADAHPSVRLFTSKKTSSKAPLLEQPAVEERWAVSSANATSDDGCPKCPNNTFPPAPGEDVAAAGFGVEVHWAGFGAGAEVQDHTQDDNWLYMSAVCYIYGKSPSSRSGPRKLFRAPRTLEHTLRNPSVSWGPDNILGGRRVAQAGASRRTPASRSA